MRAMGSIPARSMFTAHSIANTATMATVFDILACVRWFSCETHAYSAQVLWRRVTLSTLDSEGPLRGRPDQSLQSRRCRRGLDTRMVTQTGSGLEEVVLGDVRGV